MMVFFDTGFFKYKFFFLIISFALCLTAPLPCAAMEEKQDEAGIGAKIGRLLKKSKNPKYTFSNPTEIEASNNNNAPEPNKSNLSSTQKEESSNNNNALDLKPKSKQKSKSKKQTSKRSEEKELPNQSDPKEPRLSSPAKLNLFDKLPNEIFYLFFNWLTERERVVLGACSKHLNSLYYDYETLLLKSPQASENMFLPPDIPNRLISSNKETDIKEFVLFHKRYHHTLLKMLLSGIPWNEHSCFYQGCLRDSARKVSAPLEVIAPNSVTVAFLRYLTQVENLKNDQEVPLEKSKTKFAKVLSKTYMISTKKKNIPEVAYDKIAPSLQEMIGLAEYLGLSLKETFPQVSLPVSTLAGRLLASVQLRTEIKDLKANKHSLYTDIHQKKIVEKYNKLLSLNIFITIEDLWNAVNANIENKEEDPAFELIEDILRKTSFSSENIGRALTAINTLKSHASEERKNRLITKTVQLYEQLLKGKDWGVQDVENAILAYKALEDKKEEGNEKKNIKNRIKEFYNLIRTRNFNYLVSNEYHRKEAIKAHVDDGDYKWIAQLWENVLTKLQVGETVQKSETKHYAIWTHEFLHTTKNYFHKEEVLRNLIEIYEITGSTEQLAQLWDKLFQNCHGDYYGNIPSRDLLKAAAAHAKCEHLERSLELYKKVLERSGNAPDTIIKIRKAMINIYLKLDKKEKVPDMCEGMIGLYSIHLHPDKELRALKDVLEIYSKMEDKQGVIGIGYTIFNSPFYMAHEKTLEKDVYVMETFWKMGMKEETYSLCSNALKKWYYSSEEKKWKILAPLYNKVFKDPTSTQADKDVVIGLYRTLSPDPF